MFSVQFTSQVQLGQDTNLNNCVRGLDVGQGIFLSFVPADGIDKQLVWCVAERLKPQTTDMEVWGSSLTRLVVSFNRQGTLLHCGSLHPGVLPTFCWGGGPCNELASCPEGSSNTPRHASYYENRDKLQPFGPLTGVRLNLFYLQYSVIFRDTLEFKPGK